VVAITICLAGKTMFASCKKDPTNEDEKVDGKNMFKNSLIALAIVLMLMGTACGGNKSKKSNDKEEEVSEVVEEEIIQEKKEAEYWYFKNFKVSFTVNMTAGINMGKSQIVERTIMRVGEKIYEKRTASGTTMEYLTCIEDGVVVNYMFNSKANKKAARTVKQNVKSINNAALGMMNENIIGEVALNMNSSKISKAGTEKIAGIDCEIYKRDAKNEKELKELENLAKLAGNNSEKMKSLVDDAKESYAKYWINPNYDKLILKKQVHIKLNGKLNEDVAWEITELQFDNFDYSDATFDLCGYEIMNN